MIKRSKNSTPPLEEVNEVEDTADVVAVSEELIQNIKDDEYALLEFVDKLGTTITNADQNKHGDDEEVREEAQLLMNLLSSCKSSSEKVGEETIGSILSNLNKSKMTMNGITTSSATHGGNNSSTTTNTGQQGQHFQKKGCATSSFSFSCPSLSLAPSSDEEDKGNMETSSSSSSSSESEHESSSDSDNDIPMSPSVPLFKLDTPPSPAELFDRPIKQKRAATTNADGRFSSGGDGSNCYDDELVQSCSEKLAGNISRSYEEALEWRVQSWIHSMCKVLLVKERAMLQQLQEQHDPSSKDPDEEDQTEVMIREIENTTEAKTIQSLQETMSSISILESSTSFQVLHLVSDSRSLNTASTKGSNGSQYYQHTHKHHTRCKNKKSHAAATTDEFANKKTRKKRRTNIHKRQLQHEEQKKQETQFEEYRLKYAISFQAILGLQTPAGYTEVTLQAPGYIIGKFLTKTTASASQDDGIGHDDASSENSSSATSNGSNANRLPTSTTTLTGINVNLDTNILATTIEQSSRIVLRSATQSHLIKRQEQEDEDVQQEQDVPEEKKEDDFSDTMLLSPRCHDSSSVCPRAMLSPQAVSTTSGSACTPQPVNKGVEYIDLTSPTPTASGSATFTSPQLSAMSGASMKHQGQDSQAPIGIVTPGASSSAIAWQQRGPSPTSSTTSTMSSKSETMMRFPILDDNVVSRNKMAMGNHDAPVVRLVSPQPITNRQYFNSPMTSLPVPSCTPATNCGVIATHGIMSSSFVLPPRKPLPLASRVITADDMKNQLYHQNTTNYNHHKHPSSSPSFLTPTKRKGCDTDDTSKNSSDADPKLPALIEVACAAMRSAATTT